MKIDKINRESIGISAFTSVLQHIPTPPETLYITGTLPTTRPPVVAIIGSRKPTAYGIEVTKRLAGDLAKEGVIIISGLAFGVDAIAHTATLEAHGITIAVMAGGLHAVYPATHRGLAQQIITQGGALISEYAPGVEARPYSFLARNRLVSGLADAIIVTEATERSGTLSTVAHALEQNKEVFAVPGPITSLLSAGPNKLLQQGAHVALEAQDILNVIAPYRASQKPVVQLPLVTSNEEQVIVNLIQRGVRDTTSLQQKSQLAVSDFLSALTMLEVRGTIRHSDALHWTLA